jgi:hypothetical protein
MADVVPLKYGVVFKKAFGKVGVFQEFVEDVLGVKINITKVYQEYEHKETIGRVKIKYDLYAEDEEQRIIVEIQNIREEDFNDRFLYYHLISMVEQVQSYNQYLIPKTVYTVVVLTTTPRDKSIFYSAAMSEVDPFVMDKDMYGKKLGIYRHKLLFLNPRLVSENTPETIRPWLELIEDSLDEKVNENQYKRKTFQEIIRDIEKNTVSPEEAARLKDEASWENAKREAYDKGKIAGIKQGEELGIKQGIEVSLEIKFGKEGLSLMDDVRKISDIEKLAKIQQMIKKARDIKELHHDMGNL